MLKLSRVGPALLSLLCCGAFIGCSGDGQDLNQQGRPLPSIVLSTASLSFTVVLGGTAPLPQQVELSNGGEGVLDWSAAADRPWLAVSPASGMLSTGTATLGVGVNVALLSAGNYGATVTVTAPGSQNG